MLFRILTYILLFFNSCLLAQDPHYSQLFNSLYYTNPSTISQFSAPQFGLSYRNQWPGLKSAFVTYNMFYFHPVTSMKSTFGITLMHDVQGDGTITKTTPAGIYSYSVKVSDLIRLTTGIRLSYVLRNVNPEKLQFETDITGTGNYDYYGNERLKTGFFDFSMGISAMAGENLLTGISVHHVTTPNESFGNNEKGKLNYLFAFHTTGILYLSKTYSGNILLKPGMQIMNQGTYNELLYGSSLQIKVFELGLWARNDLKFRFDAVILALGFSRDSYNFYYSYDVNFKSMRFFSSGIGAHEVTFLYNFKYKEKRKNGYNKSRRK